MRSALYKSRSREPAMANKKPNYTPNNPRKSGPGLLESLLGGPSKKQTKKTHHDGLSGNRGNKSGKGHKR